MDVSVKNIKKSFNAVPVIKGVDFTVKKGERVAIVGPNGAGKTTLFRILNLALAPDLGSVDLGGVKTGELSEKEMRAMRQRIATIHQHHNLIPRFKVINNILSGNLGLWSTPKALFSLLIKPLEEEGARDILEKTGIADKMYCRTDRLSGGQQQWVAIARALFQNPELLLADEPCSSLDPRNGEKLIRLLVDWNEKNNKTVIAALHYLELALTYFPRIIGLKNGTVFFDLPVEEVTNELLQELYRDENPSEAEADESITIPLHCIPPVKI